MAKRRKKPVNSPKKPPDSPNKAAGTPQESSDSRETGATNRRQPAGESRHAAGPSEQPAGERRKRPPRGRKRPRQPKPTGGGPAEPADAPETSPGPFGGLPLSEVALSALAAADYLDPTPVQAGLIPRALKGEDLMGQAQTGTGKTAAFAIPILERLDPQVRDLPQALVLVPTRELAVQVRDEFIKLSAGRKISTVALYGGKPIRHQIEQLRRGAHVIVGTPGRVLDHIGRRTLLLEGVGCVVLDEADRMLDIGFRPDIEKILRRCPGVRQTLLFSATIPPPVMRLARQYMHDPEMLDFSPTDIAVETIEQSYFTVDPEKKLELLVCLIQRDTPQQAIIFCRTRRGTEKTAQRLARKFDAVASIHGDLPQRTRDRVMAQFRQGEIRYLVATDVVGRGIDVTRISHIINYDTPQFCDDYVHRVGRTGRMGREGVAYTFVTPEEGNELTRIEMRINRILRRDEIPNFVSFTKPEPEKAPGEVKPVFGRRQRRTRRAL